MAQRRKPTASAPVSSPAEPNRKRAFDLVMKLMAIPGGPGDEAEVAEFITQQLIQAGASPSQIQSDSANKRTLIRSETGNLIFKLPGTQKGPRRMLSAHMDTVPICVGCKPVRSKNLVKSANPKTGLGADNRAGCGAILNAALEILEHQLPHPPLTFCWFVQEEIGLHGARHVSLGKLGKPKQAFNWDGGNPHKLTIGATGGYRMTIDVHGIASHAGGAPEWGVSAIAIASLAIADLQRNGWHGAICKGKQTGTSNIGVINGGAATNVVTDHVTVRAEARSHNATFRKRIVKEIEKAFNQAAKQVKNVAGATGSVEFAGHLDYDSFKLSPKEPCVLEASEVIRDLGADPEVVIANGGLDANWLNAHGIPTVSLGCGQLNQHMVTEALSIDEYQEACRIALRLATAV